MENNIINITAEVLGDWTPPTKEETLKLIDKLNTELNLEGNDSSGSWEYIEKIGLVWVPANKKNPELPPKDQPSQLLKDIIEWGNTLNFDDDLKENSVLLIKLNVDDPYRAQMMQQIIAQKVLQPRIDILKEKHVCVMFMESGDDISMMDEIDMKKAGWEKIEKSRIITLT